MDNHLKCKFKRVGYEELAWHWGVEGTRRSDSPSNATLNIEYVYLLGRVSMGFEKLIIFIYLLSNDFSILF